MKYRRFIFFLLMVLPLTLLGCGQSKSQKQYPEYIESVNAELGCAELSYDEVTYRPFGVFSGDRIFAFNQFIGNQIGIGQQDPPTKIYEIKGYNPKEWIIEYDDVFMGGNMILKAVGVTDIPPEIEKYRAYHFER